MKYRRAPERGVRIRLRAPFAPFRGWLIGNLDPRLLRRGLVSFALRARTPSYAEHAVCGLPVCDTIGPMADFKPRPGTFRPYLEYVNREKPARPSPLTLLEILARQDRQSLPLFGLQTLSGMEPSPYGEALKSLRDADYIVIEGEAPEQLVRLTGAGAEVSRLARPA